MQWSWMTRLRVVLDAMIRKHVWHMDIAPTAMIHPSAYIDRTWPKGIHVGDRCRIDREATILAHDMTRGIYLDTVIGAGAIVGAKAVIMPGITIGQGSIVMPGAVVIRDLLPHHRAIGAPASASPLAD